MTFCGPLEHTTHGASGASLGRGLVSHCTCGHPLNPPMRVCHEDWSWIFKLFLSISDSVCNITCINKGGQHEGRMLFTCYVRFSVSWQINSPSLLCSAQSILESNAQTTCTPWSTFGHCQGGQVFKLRYIGHPCHPPRYRPPTNLVCWQSLTTWHIVWISLHAHLTLSVKHLCI